MIIGGAKLRYLTPKQVSLSGINLTNDYYSLLMKIPIAIENMKNLEFPASKQFINRLNLINKQVDILKRSWEYQVCYRFYGKISIYSENNFFIDQSRLFANWLCSSPAVLFKIDNGHNALYDDSEHCARTINDDLL